MSTSLSREDCLRRAQEFETLADISQAPNGGAYALDQARFYRSLALVAAPEGASAIDPDA